MGWSHKIPALLAEFDAYDDESFTIDVVSTVPAAERELRMQRRAFTPRRVRVTHVDADYTAPSELRRLDPASYDTIVIIGNDWLGSGEESDARTILGYLLVRDFLPDDGGPELLIELLDPGNVGLFQRRPGEVLISPLILSHMMAQVALRRELRAVFDELFGPAGAEIQFRPAADYGAGEVTFDEIARSASRRGEIALGIARRDPAGRARRDIRLNPGARATIELDDAAEIIVLTMQPDSVT